MVTPTPKNQIGVSHRAIQKSVIANIPGNMDGLIDRFAKKRAGSRGAKLQHRPPSAKVGTPPEFHRYDPNLASVRSFFIPIPLVLPENSLKRTIFADYPLQSH
jgi:hypothetical protein